MYIVIVFISGRRTNNKENANTGNRTEQTHRRIKVKKKLRLKSHSLQNTQRESLQPNYEHAKSLTKRTRGIA